MKINKTEFSVRELETVGEIVGTGDITMSILVLTLFLLAVEGGAESINESIAGEHIEVALDNLLSWYTDTFGDPIEVALHDIKFKLIMDGEAES